MITCSFQNVLWSPDLSRVFYGHLTFLECSMVTWPCHVTLAYSVPILPFTPLYTWVFEMRGEPFSYSRFSQQCTDYYNYVFKDFLRINLRLNNIFCCLFNFAFLSSLITKSTNHKSVSGHLWYSLGYIISFQFMIAFLLFYRNDFI